MEKSNKVQAIIQKDPKEAKNFKKVTENHWTVYYYLLSVSYKNYHESHRYVYRKDINISQISKELGINRATFYNSLNSLTKAYLININNDIIYLDVPEVYTTISKDLLIQLLSYRKILSIDLLRTYLFVRIIYGNDKKKEITIRNIVRCLGHSDTTSENYKKVEIYLNLLKSWNLINFTRDYKMDKEIGGYRIYTFTKVNDYSEELNNRVDKAEMLNTDGLTDDEIEYIKNKLSGL